MEKAYFIMDYYRVTQGYGPKSSNHKNTYAMDFGGKDTGIDDIYAPFTGVIKKIYSKSGSANTVWLESREPVLCANGVTTYLTCIIAHDDDVSDLKVGQVVKQGEVFMQEGRSGKATGNHVHFELSDKKLSKTGWSRNKYGKLQINNPVKPNEYLFLKENQIVLSDTYKNEKYSLKKDDVIVAPQPKYTLTIDEGLSKDEYRQVLNEIINWCNDKLKEL